MKNYNVVGKKKWQEVVLTWSNSKVVSFESNRSIGQKCPQNIWCHIWMLPKEKVTFLKNWLQTNLKSFRHPWIPQRVLLFFHSAAPFASWANLSRLGTMYVVQLQFVLYRGLDYLSAFFRQLVFIWEENGYLLREKDGVCVNQPSHLGHVRCMCILSRYV